MITSIGFYALAVCICYCPLAIKLFRCFINIQKDANERKLMQAECTNVTIYTCTKFAVRFVYVDTNNSVCSWQILYVNHVLWYMNGNAGPLWVILCHLPEKCRERGRRAEWTKRNRGETVQNQRRNSSMPSSTFCYSTAGPNHYSTI